MVLILCYHVAIEIHLVEHINQLKTVGGAMELKDQWSDLKTNPNDDDGASEYMNHCLEMRDTKHRELEIAQNELEKLTAMNTEQKSELEACKTGVKEAEKSFDLHSEEEKLH